VIGSKWSETAPASEIEKSLPVVLAEKKSRSSGRAGNSFPNFYKKNKNSLKMPASQKAIRSPACVAPIT
jgi:hypothetical protein